MEKYKKRNDLFMVTVYQDSEMSIRIDQYDCIHLCYNRKDGTEKIRLSFEETLESMEKKLDGIHVSISGIEKTDTFHDFCKTEYDSITKYFYDKHVNHEYAPDYNAYLVSKFVEYENFSINLLDVK